MARYFILLFIALLSCNAARADGLVMQFNVVRKETSLTGVSAPSLTQQDYTVTLFPQIVGVRSGDTERIYDFGGKQIFDADHARRTLRTYPLCAEVLSRQQKKEQRLRSLFAEQRTSNPALSYDDTQDVDVDMRYGGSSTTKTSGQIQTSLEARQTSFSAAGSPLAVFSASTTAIPENLKKSYAHFVLYETALHPVIWQTVSSAGAVFTTLHYTLREKDKTSEITMTLKNAQRTPAAGPDIQGLTSEITGNHTVDAAIKQSTALPMKDLKEIESKIGDLLKQKDTLRASLAAKDMELSLGGSIAQNSAIAREALQPSDPLAAAVLEIARNQPRTTEQFLQNMGKLNQAQKPAGEYAYLVEYFRANQIRSVLENRPQRSAEEENAMRAALNKLSGAVVANPWLTSAYCDLGDAYFNAQEIPRALMLWEHTARLNSGYPGLQRVRALKQRAERDFPEYF